MLAGYGRVLGDEPEPLTAAGLAAAQVGTITGLLPWAVGVKVVPVTDGWLAKANGKRLGWSDVERVAPAAGSWDTSERDEDGWPVRRCC